MAEHASLQSMLVASGDAGYVWDLKHDQMVWSGALQPIFGVGTPSHTLKGSDFRPLVYEADAQLFSVFMLQSEAGRLDRDYRIRLADGTVAWVHERGNITYSEEGLPIRVEAMLRIITARKMLEMDLSTRTRVDGLTGLPNRSHFLEMLDVSVAQSKAENKQLGYIVLAIDNMSYVNEAIGPDAADHVILGVLRRVQDMVSGAMQIGRVGGDQFGFILHDFDSLKLAEIGARVLTSFREQPVESPVCPVQISVSMGGVIAPLSVATAWEAMIRAEQSLRDAQRQGRNAFIEYTPSVERTKAHRRSLEIGQQTLHALKTDGLRLAFQPLIDAKTEEILSFEALVRMVNEKGEFIPAGLFIPVVEQLGLANVVDRKVLDLAVEALEADPLLHLAVNISGLTASQRGWPDIMREKFKGKSNAAKRLIIEITETAAILDIEETRRFVDTVHELGGAVALDDFGSGFTSIRYLRTLNVNMLKIDRELLSDVTNNQDQQVMVRTLISLASGLGLQTVGEGVETQEVADWLRAAGINEMQGYYFGKPEVDAPAKICARYDAKRFAAKKQSARL